MSSVNISSSLIIPDQVLETHICRLCDKYLTVGPISVHPDGGNICGRCDLRETKQTHCLFQCDSVEDLIEQVNIPYAIFGYVNHLFPCVNRYEGCNELLAYNEIRNHEISCKSKKIQCLRCDHYEGTGSQQLTHFKAKHPTNFFDKIYFRFALNKRYHMNLVKRNNDLFFLYLDIDVDKQNVNFFARPTSDLLDDDVDFFCLLKDVADGELIYQTTSTKRKKEGVYHTIHIKYKEDLQNYNLFCECLLRRISI